MENLRHPRQEVFQFGGGSFFRSAQGVLFVRGVTDWMGRGTRLLRDTMRIITVPAQNSMRGRNTVHRFRRVCRGRWQVGRVLAVCPRGSGPARACGATFGQAAKANTRQQAEEEVARYLADHLEDRLARRLLRRLPYWQPGRISRRGRPHLRGGGSLRDHPPGARWTRPAGSPMWVLCSRSGPTCHTTPALARPPAPESGTVHWLVRLTVDKFIEGTKWEFQKK